MNVTARLSSIKCWNEINEASAGEEVYVLITVADLRPPVRGVGIPAPPNVEVFHTPIYEYMDDDDDTTLVAGPVFWGMGGAPARLDHPDHVAIAVTVQEQDHSGPSSYATLLRPAAATALALTLADPNPASRAKRFVSAVADIMEAANETALPVIIDDDHVGTQQLVLGAADLLPGEHELTMRVVGDQGDYILGFHVTVDPDPGLPPPPASPRIGFNQEDRFMVSIGGTLAVVRTDGAVFGADIVDGQLEPVFQYTGAKIGYNPRDRFLVALENTLVVVTDSGEVFGAEVSGRNIGPVYQFTGAKIGFNPQDKFMTALGNTLVVVTDSGDVFGAEVSSHDIGPVYRFTGAPIGLAPKYLVTLGNRLVLVTSSGDIHAAHATPLTRWEQQLNRPRMTVVGRELHPFQHLPGATIGYNPWDKFLVPVRDTLAVVTSDGNVFGSHVDNAAAQPVTRLTR